MRSALTDSIITRLPSPVGYPTETWDTKVPGLMVRVYASGRRCWFVRARTAEGKHTRIKLGDYPQLGVTKARRLAADQLLALRQGRDPNSERRAARDARRESKAVLTVEQALVEWQAARTSAADAPWALRYARSVASILRVHVPPTIRSRALRDVTREMWTRMIAGVAQDKPGAGASLFTAISSFLGYAEAMGWIEHHPIPRRGRSLIAPHLPPRTRVLDDHEWLAVWKAAEREVPKLRAFVRLLLLTATRLSEMSDIAMHEITAGMTIWIIPATRVKNRREHVVPLGDLAQCELRLVWPHEDHNGDADRKLLGRFPTSGFSGHGKLLARLHQASGTANWTWHDLRRTARTTMTFLGVPEADAEAALNHISGRSKLVGIYDLSGPPASALSALRVWQGYVSDVVEGRRPSGDAEDRYRAALPEELRHRSKPKFVPRQKAKPGRPARKSKPSTG